MVETVAHLRSAHLKNERPIWIRAPHDAAAAHLVVFLDGELYRERVGTNGVIDQLGDSIADARYVFVSMASEEARYINGASIRIDGGTLAWRGAFEP